jgi:hypothetical protein
MSSPSTPIINPLTDQTISEKHTKGNHALWKMQVLTIIRGVGIEGFLTGTTPSPTKTIKAKGPDDEGTEVPNPAYQTWAAAN